MSANTAPPKNTICFRRGGSSILILNFCEGFHSHQSPLALRGRQLTFKRVGSPLSTRVRYNCFISFSRREGSPGYMLEPPERTTCLYSSVRMSTAADWIVEKSISVWGIIENGAKLDNGDCLPATPGCSTSMRCGWNMHSGASNRSWPILMTRPSGSYMTVSVNSSPAVFSRTKHRISFHENGRLFSEPRVEVQIVAVGNPINARRLISLDGSYLT